MIIIIDNYDSFTYNLYQYAGEINPDIEVFRNNKISIDMIRQKNPSHIILSPGPGFPSNAGICKDLIEKMGRLTPILGICLGHQAIGETYGGIVIHSKKLVHGKASDISIDIDCILFKSLPHVIKAGRYHSLVVEKRTLPTDLKITADSVEDEVMGFQHVTFPVFGIQFHPESLLTSYGKVIIKNFLDI
jgi:anthranilate synthase component II